MKKKKIDHKTILVPLLVLAIVVSVGGIALNVALVKSVKVPVLAFTGKVTETGTVNLTGAGLAGLSVSDAAIAVGSGYVNSTCGGDVAILQSDSGEATVSPFAEPYCWINTTAFYGTANDFHTIENNGTLTVNVSAIGSTHAQDLFCGIGSTCLNSSLAEISLVSAQTNEPSSCDAGITPAAGEVIGNNANNFTVGLCDILHYGDNSDRIDIMVNMTVPVGMSSGAKTYTITYEAVAS
jgi:hypothetical protein